MAYIDLLAMPAVGGYYRKLAKMTSLECSAYCTEILDIGATVLRKKKFDGEGFFKVDRKWVEDRTTIALTDQLNYDSMLQNMGIIDISDSDRNRIRLHLDVLAGIMIDDTNIQKVDLVKKNVKVSKSQQAANKKEYILLTLKKNITESDVDLRAAYEKWIDVVYDKGMCKVAQVQTFISDINNYTNDKVIKLRLINIAISLSYKMASWAISKYTENSNLKLSEQRTCTGVDNNNIF